MLLLLIIAFWVFLMLPAFAVEDLSKIKYEKPKVNNTLIEDDLIKFIPTSKIKLVKVYDDYDFSDINRIDIPIRTMRIITSEQAQLGESVVFKTLKPVVVNKNVVIPAGTEVIATVEYISTSRAKGEPGILIIDNFKIKGFEKYNPVGKISINGANRRLWIKPVSNIINSFTIIGGYPLYFIKGGEAKIKPNKVFEIYLWGQQ